MDIQRMSKGLLLWLSRDPLRHFANGADGAKAVFSEFGSEAVEIGASSTGLDGAITIHIFDSGPDCEVLTTTPLRKLLLDDLHDDDPEALVKNAQYLEEIASQLRGMAARAA